MKNTNNIKNTSFGVFHSRDYYKGKSFHYAGEWTQGTHYFSDDYNVDFITKDNCLLACAKGHLSDLDNEPKDFIYDENGYIIGITSKYWNFVLCGLKGKGQNGESAYEIAVKHGYDGSEEEWVENLIVYSDQLTSQDIIELLNL